MDRSHLAKSQPAIAELIALKMQDSSTKIPVHKFPGVQEKIDQYVSLIQTQLRKNPH